MINFLRKLRKRRLLRKYFQKLLPLLHKRYGHQKSYTFPQVRKTVEASGLNPKFLPYASAIFFRAEEFEKIKSEAGTDWNFEALRGELLELFPKLSRFKSSNASDRRSDWDYDMWISGGDGLLGPAGHFLDSEIGGESGHDAGHDGGGGAGGDGH